MFQWPGSSSCRETFPKESCHPGYIWCGSSPSKSKETHKCYTDIHALCIHTPHAYIHTPHAYIPLMHTYIPLMHTYPSCIHTSYNTYIHIHIHVRLWLDWSPILSFYFVNENPKFFKIYFA